MAELKTSIKEVLLCNEKVKVETAKQCKVSEAKVDETIRFLGTYVADVIRTGAMEAVMIPIWGKFRPQPNVVKYLLNKQAREANGRDMVYRAMKGRKIVDRRQTNTDETI